MAKVEIPLAQWARENRLSHYTAYNQLLTGQIDSIRRGARWFVIVEKPDGRAP